LIFLLTWTSYVSGQIIDQDQYEQFIQEAIDDNNYGKASYYSYELGKYYYSENEFDQALDYLSNSESYGKKADDNMLVYLSYQLSGNIYSDIENYSKALNNYQRALKVAGEIGKKELIAETQLNIGISYQLLDRHKRSIDPLKDALSWSIQMEDPEFQLKCYELLIDSHKNLGENNKVVEYQKLHDNIIENHQKAEQTSQQLNALEEEVQKADQEKRKVRSRLTQQSRLLRNTEDSLLATKYSLETTEQSLRLAEEIKESQKLQIELLSKEKELDEIRIKEQNARLKNAAIIRNSIIGGILLAGALVFVLIRGYRKKLEANKEIDRQNKNIQSSINYAKRIQEAMLHKNDVRKELLPESFVLYKPRDVVSGDFYWISEIKSWYDPDVVIVAADCTGHGIPGAFMSMIGMNALNGIITNGIAESNQILKALDSEIRTALQQEATGNKDGMDIALCIYRREKNIVEFSGAKNPLIYIQNGELNQIRGDIHSIGGSRAQNGYEFKKHIVSIDQPTTFYIFSDGYQDQFGEIADTKFMSKRFKRLLLEIHEKPMDEQMDILNSTIEEWKGNIKQTDDILVMGVRLDNELD